MQSVYRLQWDEPRQGTANADGLISDYIPGGIAQYSGDTIVARCQSNRAIGGHVSS